MAEPKVAAEPIKVMSFNIRFGTAKDGEDRWEVRRPRTMEMIRRQAPDVIGIQEALDFQIQEICAAFPYYRYVGVGREDGKAAGEFSAILYDSRRFAALRSDTVWLSETPNVPNSMHWGNRITRICTWAYFFDLKEKKYFWHYNVHLDHESQPSRLKGVELIQTRIRERGTNDPVLFTGDFNAGESNEAVLSVKAFGLKDSFRVLHPDVKAVGTFNGFNKPGVDKIDYVFVDEQWEAIAAEILSDRIDGRYPSDHFPVIAVVKRR